MREYNNKQLVCIADLELSLQTRAATDAATVEEYAEAMRSGAQFPAIRVRDIGTAAQPRLIVADGLHRIAAARLNGKTEIIAEVLPGSLATAYLDALGANTAHGLRRTNADKRHALEMAWAHRREIWRRDDGADPSAEVLAKACGVSLRMVKDFLTIVQPVQIAPVEPGAETVQPVQIAPVEQVAQSVKMPRRVFGMDGKVRAVPPKMPMRPMRAAVGFGAATATAGHLVPVDRYGVEIPTEIGTAFSVDVERELRDVLQKLSEVRVVLRRGLDGAMPAYAAMRQDALVQLNNAYSFVKAAFPHCVCRMCQGQGCEACHRRGWQTEEEYNRNPKEFKAKVGAA